MYTVYTMPEPMQGLTNMQMKWNKIELNDGACFKVANNHDIGTAVVAKGAVMNWDIDYDPTGDEAKGGSATDSCLAHSTDTPDIILLI